jgi:isoquinoline 1-oxidoreductase alpha subunit
MITLNVNGKRVQSDAEADTPLLWVLRDYLNMTGTKFGCGSAVVGKKVVTVERIGQTRVGAAVQAAWVAENVPQCGYCQSGQVMAAAALLAAKPKPTDADIDEAMSGNLCRCATYPRIRAAIKRAAGSLA